MLILNFALSREIGDKASYTGSHSILKSKQPEVRLPWQFIIFVWVIASSTSSTAAAVLPFKASFVASDLFMIKSVFHLMQMVSSTNTCNRCNKVWP